MKQLSILILVLTLFLGACTNKTAEYLSLGDQAYLSDNYELALLNWEKVISVGKGKTNGVDPQIYAKAGEAAFNLDQTNKAKEYLSTAYNNGIKTPEVLTKLASIYKKADNLSYEISYLEQLVKENKESQEINSYHTLLLDAYVRSENWEKASDLWAGMDPETTKNANTLSNWLRVQKALKNTTEAYDVSKQLLALDPNNLEALEIQAKHHYHKAEALYQREMAAYNSKKTRAQYAKLLKALKLATKDFKVARDHFETLYKNDQRKDYARFLSNIYARLSNKQKSDYYKKLSK